MRNMSFSLTVEQMRNRTKTVTRRLGWKFLNPSDLIQPVIKGQGLKRGERVQKIGTPILIVSTHPEQIKHISQEDVRKEGFPNWTPKQFVHFFCQHNHCEPNTIVNVIEFEFQENTR